METTIGVIRGLLQGSTRSFLANQGKPMIHTPMFCGLGCRTSGLHNEKVRVLHL